MGSQLLGPTQTDHTPGCGAGGIQPEKQKGGERQVCVFRGTWSLNQAVPILVCLSDQALLREGEHLFGLTSWSQAITEGGQARS